MKKIYSFNELKGVRIQIVKNDNKLRYELYKNRKLEAYDTNIYWLKRKMAALIHFELLGIIYNTDNEKSVYKQCPA